MIRARPTSLSAARAFVSAERPLLSFFFGHGPLLYQKMIRPVFVRCTKSSRMRRTAQSEWRTMKRASALGGWQFYGNRHHTSIIHKGKWLFFDSLKHVRTRLEFPILAPDSRYSCNHHVITQSPLARSLLSHFFPRRSAALALHIVGTSLMPLLLLFLLAARLRPARSVSRAVYQRAMSYF